MKMKERRPVHFPCRNHWFLTSLTLVSLVVTTTLGQEFSEIEPTEDLSPSARQSSPLTNGSSTQTSSVVPGKLMPSHFSSSSQSTNPPTTATFQMECSAAGYIWDLCWLDNNTMVWIQSNDTVFKVLVNRENKSCSYTELGSHPNSSPRRVACSPETGEIYVTDSDEDSVWVYDRNSLKALWKPEGLVGKPYTLAINRERMAVGTIPKGYLYVYGRNREYIGQINLFQNQYQFWFTQLTEDGLFVATTSSGNRLITHELGTGLTITTGGEGSENGQFNSPWGVSIVGDYILVSDFYNDRVPVFARNLGFHGNLQFKGANLQRPYTQAYRSETKLLAMFTTISPYNVKIFSLT